MRAQAQLGQAKGTRVIDQVRRQPQRVADSRANGHAVPFALHVDQEFGRAALGVVQPRHAYPDRGDVGVLGDGLAPDVGELLQDRVRPDVVLRRHLVVLERSPRAVSVFDDRPFEVRRAQIEAEVPPHAQCRPAPD